MATNGTNPQQSKDHEEAFFESLPSKNLMPLWTQLAKLVPPMPNPKASVATWKYAEVKPLLLQAGEIVDAEEAERRVLMLVNPAMDAPHTTDTIYSGLQLVLPNEIAPAHRHVAFALRFIIEGELGFTAVEGRKMIMSRGDVILTPSWLWHDHGNEGQNPVIWLDGLDLPLFKYAPINFAETYSEKRYPSELTEATPWCFPWNEVEASLKAQSGVHRVHHYHNKQGGHLSSTLSAQAEMIEAGQHTAVVQETCSFVYHCYEGKGETRITNSEGKETVVCWDQKDTFAVPAWSRIQHFNKGADVAYLFAINDRPQVKGLGLYRKGHTS